MKPKRKHAPPAGRLRGLSTDALKPEGVMRHMQPFRYVAFISLLWIGPSTVAQTVTVRVLSASDERPLPKQQVSVSLLYYKEQATPAKYNAHLTLQTDENGEARFLVPQPPPGDLDVRVAIDWGRWHCGCNLLVATEDVIQKGIVDSAASANDLRRSPALVRPVPGEIRFIVRPLSFFERLLAPLLKQ